MSVELGLDALTKAKRLIIPERIESERLVLIASDVTQAEATFEAAYESRHELSPWMPWAYPEPTWAATSAFHADVRAKWFASEMLDFQIVEKSSGKLIGKCGFHSIDWSVPRLEIGYWLRTSAAGNGYCAEAVKLLVTFGKDELNAVRLEIRSDPRNAKSRAVAERCGFTLDGILKQNMRGPDGNLRDSCVYALVLV